MERVSVEVVRRPMPRARARAAARVWPWALALALLGSGSWALARPGFLVWQLARDHKRGLAELPGGSVFSSEPAVVAEWLERHGTPVPPLPSQVGGAALVGARYCALVDRVAAHVLYEGQESSVSLFVLSAGLSSGARWPARTGGLHLRFLRAAGRTLAIVGEREAEVLAAHGAFATSVARGFDPPRPSW